MKAGAKTAFFDSPRGTFLINNKEQITLRTIPLPSANLCERVIENAFGSHCYKIDII